MVTNRDKDKKVGKIIEEKRRERGFTQDDLAELAKISTMYYRDITAGRNRPNWVIMSSLCEVLGIDQNYITDTYIKPDLDETAREMGLEI